MCLATHNWTLRRWPPLNVKLLLPPRQSRGTPWILDPRILVMQSSGFVPWPLDAHQLSSVLHFDPACLRHQVQHARRSLPNRRCAANALIFQYFGILSVPRVRISSRPPVLPEANFSARWEARQNPKKCGLAHGDLRTLDRRRLAAGRSLLLFLSEAEDYIRFSTQILSP